MNQLEFRAKPSHFSMSSVVLDDLSNIVCLGTFQGLHDNAVYRICGLAAIKSDFNDALELDPTLIGRAN